MMVLAMNLKRLKKWLRRPPEAVRPKIAEDAARDANADHIPDREKAGIPGTIGGRRADSFRFGFRSPAVATGHPDLETG